MSQNGNMAIPNYVAGTTDLVTVINNGGGVVPPNINCGLPGAYDGPCNIAASRNAALDFNQFVKTNQCLFSMQFYNDTASSEAGASTLNILFGLTKYSANPNWADLSGIPRLITSNSNGGAIVDGVDYANAVPLSAFNFDVHAAPITICDVFVSSNSPSDAIARTQYNQPMTFVSTDYNGDRCDTKGPTLRCTACPDGGNNNQLPTIVAYRFGSCGMGLSNHVGFYLPIVAGTAGSRNVVTVEFNITNYAIPNITGC